MIRSAFCAARLSWVMMRNVALNGASGDAGPHMRTPNHFALVFPADKYGIKRGGSTRSQRSGTVTSPSVRSMPLKRWASSPRQSARCSRKASSSQLKSAAIGPLSPFSIPSSVGAILKHRAQNSRRNDRRLREIIPPTWREARWIFSKTPSSARRPGAGAPFRPDPRSARRRLCGCPPSPRT